MPLIQVQMFSGRTSEQKRNLVRALTDAFVQTAGSTPDAVDVILTDVEKSDWAQGGELFSDKTPAG
ncbi:MAG: 4-oxalocrotonate tautomerase [Acidiferrobacteraceae bacterium]|jgi:4-oxalocrotonate tautomerase|nr:4-oxalocrotonate tautomerase [Acidiferrobacteraceae bacterium]